MEEITEGYKYILQDPYTYIQFAINIGASLLALGLYVVIKVWVIRNELKMKAFFNSNKPFWVWHFVATVFISAISILMPNGLVETLMDFGIAIKADASFFSIGFMLAGMAYGEKKKEMLDYIEKAKFKKETGYDPDQPIL